ncbi:MAG: flagellar hook-basal body complex protein FliE [Lachnospiraceae bacterium]|jgi:flagellar hook-basal body complex protein FliE|nr:flagellar hook-basal body complex protein FliE [Lachnospiraceae bacterium]MBR6302640.1 flagellar hook-basal body complex protein FliE [Lachnospiraceae bacterium]MBR6910097.1 flagellar hook-basal body complex protein FliE [Lachnospiraceae bacterium]
MTGATNDVTKLTNVKGLGMDSSGVKTDGTMFEAALNSAINNITRTNSYLSDAENQEILFALGESDSTHDLTIALEKASTALQYTVAIRDRVLDAYKELMQIQI